MDDRLQRRLRDADPLTAADGQAPSPVRLDAIKEQIMQTDERPVRAAIRPRALGLVGIAAVSLALVLVVGSLARPTATTLAWAPEPTAVTTEQKAAAEKACTENVVIGSGTIQGAGGIIEGGEGEMPALPPAPVALPPLVSLELHGNGGVAILSDGTVTGYCLLKWDGTTFTAGGLAFGMGVPAGFEDGFLVSGMSTEFEGQSLGIVAGASAGGCRQGRGPGRPGRRRHGDRTGRPVCPVGPQPARRRRRGARGLRRRGHRARPADAVEGRRAARARDADPGALTPGP